MSYADRIAELDHKHDPRHIEAYMRVKYSSLDSLSPKKFASEVKFAGKVVDFGGLERAEETARRFGL